jgi:hypothetical protein
MDPRPTETIPTIPRTGFWRRQVLLFLVVTAGYCALALSPLWQSRLGILGNGVWFLDSYAILASSDAMRQGLDPAKPNPLDVYQRPHSYSNWWFGLGRLGLTRDDNFLVGGSWVVAFLLTAVLVLRPRRRAELAWHALLLLSPPVLLAVNRANNDLVVFALLSLGLWATGREAQGNRPGWFGGALALGAGLKFFPVAAAGAFLGLRPGRRGLIWTVAASVLALAVLGSVWTDFRRAVIPVPIGTHVFGAAVFWGNLGWTGRMPVVCSLLALAAAAWWLTQRGCTTALARPDDKATDGERLAFLTGALLLLVCFAGGISYAYRWVLGLWLAPWLWTQAWENPAPGAPRNTARLMCILLTVALWMDGLYCATVNTFAGPMTDSRVLRWEEVWNLCAQPVVWASMTLLAGWVAGVLLAAARDLLAPAQSRPDAG